MKLERPDVPYTQVTNIVLQDATLSWKARGIFAYLFSKPADWDFSTHRMKNDSTDGRDSLLKGLKELKDHNYLKQVRQGDGRMKYVLLYGDPQSGKPTEEPQSGNPTVGKSHGGISRPVSNKDGVTKKEEESNKENVNKKTPKEVAQWFFKAMQEIPLQPDAQEFLIQLTERTGLSKGTVWLEVKSFVAYWTESTPDGKRQRWGLEKTFEVKPRLQTWFMNHHKMAMRQSKGSPAKRGKGLVVATPPKQ